MSNDGGTVTTYDIKIDGGILSDADLINLRRVTVERSWSAADRAVLEFRSPDFEFPGGVDDPLTVQLVIGGRPQTPLLFAGTIVGVGLRVVNGEGVVVVEALDDRHKLARKIEPKTYEKVKLDDVVSQIASANGMTAESSLGATVFEHFIVADSHFAVLQHIARRTGTVWNLVDKKLVFTAPDTSQGHDVDVTLGENVIDIDLRLAPVEIAADIAVNGWDQAQGQAIVGKATTKQIQSMGKTVRSPSGVKATAWGGGAIDAEDASKMAKAIDRRLRIGDVIGQITVVADHRLQPGKLVKLDGVGDTFAGKYIISDVTHRLGDLDGSATTEFRIGPPDMSLDQLLGDDDRIGGRAPEGVTIGIVTESKDPDNLGRVRVKLPLLSDQLQTGWIRTASVGSGTDRGIVFVPEVNDEVLVAFEHGELNRPYVIGALWNKPGSAFQGAANDNKTDERRLVSRLGSAIRFVDKDSGDATSGISIEMDGAKTKIFMGYKQVTIETQGRPLEIKNGKASIKMENDDITITANNITIDAKQKLDVKSTMDTTIKAGQNATIEASVQLNAKSNAGTTVESSAITTVKGSMVQVN
ncbi:MAG: hypothetical protein KDB37_12775 [Ilumatobacter sp.]|nr:hypothetical protein [Ilumatobacter sp.]